MKNLGVLIALIITVLVETYVLFYVKKHSSKSNNQLITSFIYVLLCMIFWCIGLIIQIFVINYISEDYAVYVDYFVYIFSILIPVALFFFAYIFKNNHITFKKWYLTLFIIPVISMLVLWTNDFHHLFYESYSTNVSQTRFGPFCTYIYTYYSYITLGIDIFMLLRASIKKTSFHSIQTLLIIASIMVPLTVSIISSFNILPSTIYNTPISFSVCTILLRNCNIQI